jgi:predicted HicB family RNase H-like nuclease
MRNQFFWITTHFDSKDLIFYGKLEFIHALISFEGETAKEIDHAFKEAVNDYISICAEREVEPEKPFKGSLNVRIGRDRHEKSAIIAKEIGCASINDFIKLALDHEFERWERSGGLAA